MSQYRRRQTITEEVAYAVECDNCGRVETLDTPQRSWAEPDGWTHFSSYHSDWGNDSIESHEDHDACSWACYVAIARRVVDDYAGQGATPHPSLVVDDHGWTFLRDMLAANPT